MRFTANSTHSWYNTRCSHKLRGDSGIKRKRAENLLKELNIKENVNRSKKKSSVHNSDMFEHSIWHKLSPQILRSIKNTLAANMQAEILSYHQKSIKNFQTQLRHVVFLEKCVETCKKTSNFKALRYFGATPKKPSRFST